MSFTETAKRMHAEWEQGSRRTLGLVILLSSACSLTYLSWRGLYTLNTQTPLNSVISMTLFGAEIFGFISLNLFFFQNFKPRRKTAAPVPVEALPSVDILVTIYNEPLVGHRRSWISGSR